MLFAVHGASQASHLHLLVRAQLGFHGWPQGTHMFPEAACRQVPALRNTNFPGHSPHLQHSRRLSCCTGTMLRTFSLLTSPPPPLFTYHCWAKKQKKQKQERKQSHNAGKKREPTNEQAEAVIIRMVQQVHFWEPNRYFNANVQQRMAFSPRLHRPKGTVDDYGY